MKKQTSVVLITFLLTLAGCGGGSERKAGATKGDASNALVIVFSNSPTNLDSRVGNDDASGRVFDLIYSGLVKLTPGSDYAPDIAEKWETPDDRTIIFHLRPNIKFQDGRPLTSKDVKWTYDSLMAASFETSKKSGYAAVDKIEAPDPNTVIFRLKQPNGGLFDNLTLGIIPEGSDSNVFKSKPVTAGPYKVVEFSADDKVVLEAFEGHHLGAPKIKRVVCRIIPDATTRDLEMRKGSANFAINNLPLDNITAYEKNAEFSVMKEPGAAYQYLAFNLRDPILRKKAVREAIAHGVDRERIVRDLLRGYGTVTDTMFPVGHWARAASVPTHAYDPAKAKALLDSVGYRDPDGDGPKSRFKLLYKTSTDAEANQQAEMIQQMLKQVGIEIQIQSNEFGTFFEDIQKGNFQIFSLRRLGVSDPDFYNVIFHSKSIPPEGQNRGFYQNPKVDQLIEQGRATFDRAKRKQAYEQVQTILADELPYLSLYNRVNIAVMRKNISGFQMYPSGFLLAVPQMTLQ